MLRLLPALIAGGLVAAFAFALAPTGMPRLIGLIAAGVVAMTVWWWSGARSRRLRRALRRPLPTELRERLIAELPFVASLSESDRERFFDRCRLMLAEVPISGVGCEVDEHLRWLIAAGFSMVGFGYRDWEPAMLKRVLVYPRSFNDPLQLDEMRQSVDALGMVTHGAGLLDGIMALSLADIRDGFADPHDRHNVVIHECAHLFDRANGFIDGMPPGLDADERQRWCDLVAEHVQHGRGSRVIRPYGQSKDEEFFAVASEVFFEDPAALRAEHPDCYRLLRRVYRLDPLSWAAAGSH